MDFIKQMFSENNKISSKRVNGTIGWVCAIVFIAIWNRDLIAEMMYTSAALIGLDSLKNGILGLKKSDKNSNSIEN